MRHKISLLSAIGLLVSVAYAQAQSALDGTYQPFSSQKVSQTYVTKQGIMGECPDRTPGPLTISNNTVEFISETGHHFEGTVNSQGQLLMKGVEQATTDGNPFRMNVTGAVDATGTANVRQLGNSCTYDFAFRRQ